MATTHYTATAKDTYDRTASDTLNLSLPATLNFAYDYNGDLTNDGRRVFEYDSENQLTNVYVAGAWRSEFKYDAFGRRRVRREYTWQSSAWVKTNEVRYVYDGLLTVQERDANNLAMVSYTRGNDLSGTRQGAGGIGGLLARTDHSTRISQPSAAHAYYHCDGNGNVTALVDTNGFIVARYQYDPYGNLLGMSGPLAEANTYRFSSKEWCANAGLYYYGFRFYEPNLQRWPNRDPLGDIGTQVLVTGRRMRHAAVVELSAEGPNLYRYVRNRPTGLFDPYGLVSLPPGWGGPGRPYDPSMNPFAGPFQWPWSDPNYNKAKEWLRKCHPELQCPTVLIPLPGDRGGQSLIFFSLIDFQAGKGVDGYIDDLAHEGMHCRNGPAWGAAHDAMYEHADLIAREYWKDPEGKNCKCNGEHPGARPPAPPPPFTNWGGF